MSESSGSERSNAPAAVMPSEMRMKLSTEEFAVVKVSLEELLLRDGWLRDDYDQSFFQSGDRRDAAEALFERVKQLPTRSKAGLKGMLTRSGVPKAEQREQVPWLFEDELVPAEMRLKLTPTSWTALESVACATEYIHRVHDYDDKPFAVSYIADEFGVPEMYCDTWLSPNGTEINENLLNRVLLLPRKSLAGVKALVTRSGGEVEFDDFDDYRSDEYHEGARLIYSHEGSQNGQSQNTASSREAPR